jgi:hypothetical protein
MTMPHEPVYPADPAWTDAQHAQSVRLFAALCDVVHQEIATGTLSLGMLHAALTGFLGDTLGRSAVNAHASRTTLLDDANAIAQHAIAL